MNYKSFYKSINKTLRKFKVNNVLDRAEASRQAKTTQKKLESAIYSMAAIELTPINIKRFFFMLQKADFNRQISNYFMTNMKGLSDASLNALRKLLINVSNDSGQNALNILDIDTEFNLRDKTIVNKRISIVYDSVLTTLSKFLAIKVEEARDQGLTPEEAVKYIKDELRNFSINHSNLIVDNELANVSGETEYHVFRSAGVQTLRWVTTLDDRVCPICAPMDGKIQTIDRPFIGGDNLSSSNFPPIHIGCRCFLQPVNIGEVNLDNVWKG